MEASDAQERTGIGTRRVRGSGGLEQLHEWFQDEFSWPGFEQCNAPRQTRIFSESLEAGHQDRSYAEAKVVQIVALRALQTAVLDLRF